MLCLSNGHKNKMKFLNIYLLLCFCIMMENIFGFPNPNDTNSENEVDADPTSIFPERRTGQTCRRYEWNEHYLYHHLRHCQCSSTGKDVSREVENLSCWLGGKIHEFQILFNFRHCWWSSIRRKCVKRIRLYPKPCYWNPIEEDKPKRLKSCKRRPDGRWAQWLMA